MASGRLVAWHGEQITRRVEAACRAGIDETLAACLAVAIPRAPIRTGFLRGSAFVRRAQRGLGGIVGSWGFSAHYAPYLEFGTVRMSPRPFIRPAADLQYPLLASRIRRAYARG